MKNYYYLLAIAIIFLNGDLFSQSCTVAPPVVSGNTLAACSSSAIFTLTASAQSTNTIAWFNGGGQVSSSSVFVTPAVTSSMTYSAAQIAGYGTQTLTMPSHNSAYSSMVRGYWFQSPITFTITGVWVPTDVGTGNASAAVLKLPSTPPTYPTTSNSFTTAFLAQNQPGTAVMTVTIPVLAGDYIGVLGSRASSTSYGTSPYTSSIGSTTLTITRFGMQYDLSTTTPQDVWTESGGSVGRVFLYGLVPCMSSLVPVTLSVTPNAVLSIGTSTTKICSGASVSLSAQGVNSYTWSTTAQSPSITVSPNTTTTYSVVGSSGGTCTANSAITISVDPGLPAIVATPNQTAICYGNTVSLSGSGNSNNTYTWTGGITNGTSFTPTSTASYTVSGANSCGIGTAVATVTVNPNPVINTTTLTTICDGSSATLTASGAQGYTWTPGNATGSVLVVTPSTSTPYLVTGINQFGCTSAGNAVVLVNPNPTVTAGASATAVCPGGTVTLISGSSGGSYQWSTGGTAPGSSATPQQYSVYTLTVTNQFSCSSTASVAVDVYQPTISVTSATTVCFGNEVTLTAGAATGYTWSVNQGNFSSMSFTPQASAVITVTASVNMGNDVCMATNSTQVTVNPNPTVTINSPKTTVCRHDQYVLTASGAASYLWGQGSQTNTAQINFSVTGLQTYTVAGTTNGCTSVASVQIQVNSCNGVTELTAYAFQVFPNPNNGNFIIKGASSAIVDVFDVLGAHVLTIVLDGNNGYSAEVRALPTGVYLVTSENTVIRKVVVSN